MLFTGDVRTDAVNLCGYVDSFYESLGLEEAEISVEKMFAVASGMVQDCPYPHGIEAASPFKKVASFTCNFVAERPIVTQLPLFGELASHQNAIVAFTMSLDMLENAEIQCDRRGTLVLANRVSVSEHFLKDTINALSFVKPSTDFPLVALLYEVLAYEANPGISCDKVF